MVRLCYRSECVADTGFGLLNDATQFQAKFAGSAVADLVGDARGKVTLTVKGLLAGYAAGFVAQASCTVMSGAPLQTAVPAPATTSLLVRTARPHERPVPEPQPVAFPDADVEFDADPHGGAEPERDAERIENP